MNGYIPGSVEQESGEGEGGGDAADDRPDGQPQLGKLPVLSVRHTDSRSKRISLVM